MTNNVNLEQLDEDFANSKRQGAFDRLINEVEAKTEVVFGDDGKVYASIDASRRFLVVDIEGQEFTDFLYLTARNMGLSAARSSISQIAPTLRAQARQQRTRHTVFRRIGHADDTIYLDRCAATNSVVVISKAGMRVADNCPIKFVRTPEMAELPLPDRASAIHELRKLVPQLNDENYKKLVASLLTAVHPTGPYPITMIEGPQNTGKSTIARFVRLLLDPCPKELTLRTLAGAPRDFWVQVHNERIPTFDNVTRIPPCLEDEMCQVATGGAFSSRSYYTNDRQTVVAAKRPIFITCIHNPTVREDLLSRMLTIHVSPVREGQRRAEQELDAEFYRLRPKIFGGLCKALVACLKGRGNVQQQARSIRMQDALEFVTGAERELGWPSGTFASIYAKDQQTLMDDVFDDDPLGGAVLRLFQARRAFRGTATQLLTTLEQFRTPGQHFPGRNDLRNRLKRLSPLFARRGITIDDSRRTPDRNRERLIIIRRPIPIPKPGLTKAILKKPRPKVVPSAHIKRNRPNPPAKRR